MKNNIKKFGFILVFVMLFTSSSFAKSYLKYEDFFYVDMDMDYKENRFKMSFYDDLDLSNDNVSSKNIYIVDESFDKDKYKDYIKVNAYDSSSVSLEFNNFPFENNKIYYLCVDKNILKADGTKLGVDIQNPFKLNEEYYEKVELENKKIEEAIRKELNIYNKDLTKGNLNEVNSLTFDNSFDLSNLEELEELSNLDKLIFKDYDFTKVNELNFGDIDNFYIELEFINCKIDNFDIFDDNRTFTLNNCEINNLQSLSNKPYLEELKFHNMDLTKFDLDSIFKNLKSVDVFYLVDCNVKDTKFISNLKETRKLYIKGNLEIDCLNLVKCKSLEDIDLEYTKLKNIEQIGYLKNVICLSISYSDLDEIKLNEMCKNKKSFDYLELTNCNLKNIDFVDSLDELDILNISYNQIQNISDVVFQSDLTNLNISNNNLKDISNIANLKGVVYLNISNNKLNNIDILKELKSLSSLNISDNEISNINVIDSLKELDTLNISKEQNEKFKEKLQDKKNIKINVN